MNTATIIAVSVLVIGWAVITIPTRVLLPFLVAKQLASKDKRLARLLSKISLLRINKRADSIEKLMKKPQNIRFMRSRYPVMFRWYTLTTVWSTRILFAFAALVLIFQLIGVAKFASDPKGEWEKMHNAAENWKSRE